MKSREEIKIQYLETLQKYTNYQREFDAIPQLQNPSEGTVVPAVAEAVEKMAAKPHVSGLGMSGPQTHLTMNLAGRQKAEISKMIEIKIASPANQDILKLLQVHKSPAAMLRMYHGRLLKTTLISGQ